MAKFSVRTKRIAGLVADIKDALSVIENDDKLPRVPSSTLLTNSDVSGLGAIQADLEALFINDDGTIDQTILNTGLFSVCPLSSDEYGWTEAGLITSKGTIRFGA